MDAGISMSVMVSKRSLRGHPMAVNDKVVVFLDSHATLAMTTTLVKTGISIFRHGESAKPMWPSNKAGTFNMTATGSSRLLRKLAMTAGYAQWMLSSAIAEQPTPLAPIIVTAQRPPADLSKKIITANDIRANHYEHVTDALTSVPGVYVAQQGSQGQPTAVFIRGGNSEHTNVMIDGIRANDPTDPSGAFNFAGLGTEGAASITVLKGASIADSTLNAVSGDALSGSIAIDTKRGTGAPTIDTLLEGGSFNTYLINTGIQGATDAADYHIRFAHEGSRGTRTTPLYLCTTPRQSGKDPSDRVSLIARTGAAFNDTWRVNMWNRVQKANAFYADAYRVNPARLSTTDTGFHRAEIEGTPGRHKTTVGYSHAQTDRTVKNAHEPFVEEITYTGRIQTLYTKNDIYVNKHYTTHVQLATERQEYQAENAIHQTVNAHAIHQTAEIGHTIKPIDAWLIELWGKSHHHRAFKQRYSTKALTRYVLKQTGTTMLASYSTGIRAPSLAQLNDPLSGNGSLRPEASKGYDIGFEQDIITKRLTAGSTYFMQNFHDLIENQHITDDQWKYSNVGRAKTHGVESFVSATLAKPLTLRFEHTFLHAKDAIQNRQLMRRPMHKIGAQVIITVTDALRLGAGWIKYGKYADFAPETQGRIYKHGRGIMRLWATYKLTTDTTPAQTDNTSKASPHTELLARIENATNAYYEYPVGFTAPGVAVYVGARLQFG